MHFDIHTCSPFSKAYWEWLECGVENVSHADFVGTFISLCFGVLLNTAYCVFRYIDIFVVETCYF
jgi:hypothetical protein